MVNQVFVNFFESKISKNLQCFNIYEESNLYRLITLFKRLWKINQIQQKIKWFEEKKIQSSSFCEKVQNNRQFGCTIKKQFFI